MVSTTASAPPTLTTTQRTRTDDGHFRPQPAQAAGHLVQHRPISFLNHESTKNESTKKGGGPWTIVSAAFFVLSFFVLS
jgi:hypothetical protein